MLSREKMDRMLAAASYAEAAKLLAECGYGELSALTRDLLVRKTAPQGGAALLTGGYDETTMRRLSNQFQTVRLVQMLGLLQTMDLSPAVCGMLSEVLLAEVG